MDLEVLRRAGQGDKEARDTMVEENLGLIWSIVRRFTGRGCEMEDLFQIGCIGLIKAIDKFDLSYDVQFSTYAVPLITGEIKRFLRDDGMIKVSRIYKENAVKINRAAESLKNELGREPTTGELEERTGLSKEDIVLASDACSEVESIYKTIYQGDGTAISVIDRIGDGRNDHELVENRMAVKSLLEGLEEQERELMILRYFKEKTQMETAAELGISQVQVSRQEKKILNKLRKRM